MKPEPTIVTDNQEQREEMQRLIRTCLGLISRGAPDGAAEYARRAGELLKAMERERARKGKQPGAKSGKLPHLGDTRDAVGRGVGMSGKTYERAKAVALGLALEAIEKPKAKERKREGQKSGGRGRKKLGGKLPASKEADTRDAVGVALGLALEAIEKPKAKERKCEAGKTRGKGKRIGAGKLPGAIDTRDAVGAGVGMSGKTYERAKAVTAAR